MKKVILLNGAIRDTEEFLLIIDCILYKLSKTPEAIDVVISTWHEDISSNRELFDWVIRQGIKVVGSSGLDVGGPANIFRQWRTLDAGLSVIASDSLVLKGRTDKFLLRKDVVDAFISLDLEAEKVKSFVSSDKLAVEHISISLPFMAKDMIYLGCVSAIRKTLSYSVRTQYVADHMFNGIGPECFLWLESCSNNPFVMSMIQKVDFREVSNKLLRRGSVFDYDWNTLDEHLVVLFRYWIEAFDQEFSFVTDILDCNKADTWCIDEGSWKYQTGDREEYEELKLILNKLPKYALNDPVTDTFINSSSIISASNTTVANPVLPFSDKIDEIRKRDEREFSDIVILRQQLITREISKKTPDVPKLQSALKWNIRQRDRMTLDMVYKWMLEKAKEAEYVVEEDKIFALERMIDFFTFKGEHGQIEEAIRTLRGYFVKSPILSVRLAEYYFTRGDKYKALFHFWKSSKNLPDSLGVNHGMGCTLLDLGFPKIALKYLRRAHQVMPNDSTAAFTLIRALHAIGSRQAALTLLPILSDDLQVEAKKILNVEV
ncbi:tetratricopeptide repeat protein [Vibrio sonorensis]|uniref:tetratricopeptide repeat protein n=1 Tax=Vibrio sonorensis TaxID=1004316 RepID=UPI0008D9E435|nr:hypothetical protein [Vibrio sonorensis]